MWSEAKLQSKIDALEMEVEKHEKEVAAYKATAEWKIVKSISEVISDKRRLINVYTKILMDE